MVAPVFLDTASPESETSKNSFTSQGADIDKDKEELKVLKRQKKDKPEKTKAMVCLHITPFISLPQCDPS